MSGQLHYSGPIVLAILDGVGLRRSENGNAVKLAHTEFLNHAVTNFPTVALKASGEAVGITAGTMGNSEVGHNALGSGQIVKQGIAKIEEAFSTGKIWESDAWQTAIDRVVKNGSTLHFSGIFSDGRVHSDIEHLKRMITRAHDSGVNHIRIHLVLDGRDVAPQSATTYIADLESFIDNFPDHPDYRIASGGGRMVFVADRYENDWSVVRAGWDAIVHGRAPHYFTSATAALGFLRAEDPSLQDQYVPPFVIAENNQPVGCVHDGDAFIYFDFRADRAIEIAQAFTYDDFPYFDRGHVPDVYFAGLTEYNSDTHVPAHRLVEPIEIHDTLSQFLGLSGVSQLAVAETVKFGHITYYFNGNSYEKAPLEDHLEIPSDTLPFNTRPWMKSAETADAVLKNLEQYKFIRCNFAAGDMVGHFAELESTITAIEAIDIQLARLAQRISDRDGLLIITADHGNAEELIDDEGNPKTAHTTNPVPCIFYDTTTNKDRYRLATLEDAGISNIAPTIATLLGFTDLPPTWRSPLIVCD